MTVSTTVNRKVYAGNGSTTVFPTTFSFFVNTDLVVTLVNDTTGVETLQVLTTNYTVSGGSGSTGDVTMLVAPPSGNSLVIERLLPKTQTTDYVENDDFPADSHEQALDRLVMLVQELFDKTDRSLILPAVTALSGLTLPQPGADLYLKYNAAGTDLELKTVTGLGALGLPVSVANGGTNAITAAAARTNLGFPLFNLTATTAPTKDEDTVDGYSVGSLWIDVTNDNIYRAVDVSAGAAIWRQLNVHNESGNVLASHKNLIVTENTGTPNSQIDIDADWVILEDSNSEIFKATTVNLTADIAASGANGLDIGSEAADTWYYLWVIYNGTTVASLISASSTAPTMPTGYTFKGLVGAVRNNASSNFLGMKQVGAHTRLDSVIQDVNDASSGTTAVLATLTVPPNLLARLHSFLNGTVSVQLLLTAISQPDVAPTANLFTHIVGAGSNFDAQQNLIEVDGSSQIRYRADVSANFEVYTIGWSFQ